MKEACVEWLSGSTKRGVSVNVAPGEEKSVCVCPREKKKRTGSRPEASGTGARKRGLWWCAIQTRATG